MIETYVSVDIETDGPWAGENSILSIGSAAYSDQQLVSQTLCGAQCIWLLGHRH